MEALVGWLLDHADVQVTDLSDADTGSEECSDEEVVEDVDATAYAVVSAPLVPSVLSSGFLCTTAGHEAKLRSAAWVFCLLTTFSFKTDPCSNI